jgi:hypothetical protein
VLDGAGRVDISLKLRISLPDLPRNHSWAVNEFGVEHTARPECPRLQIVIFVIGSKSMCCSAACTSYLDCLIVQVSWRAMQRLLSVSFSHPDIECESRLIQPTGPSFSTGTSI